MRCLLGAVCDFVDVRGRFMCAVRVVVASAAALSFASAFARRALSLD